MPDKISAFVDAVAGEIRWKKARPLLTEEIRTHLLDQRDDLLAEGIDESAAEAEAVRQMGDPVRLGADLDRIHRPRPQWGLLVFAFVLALAGMLLRYTLLANPLLDSRMKDVLALIIGSGCLLFGYRLDVSFLGRWAGVWVVGLIAVIGILGGFVPRVMYKAWIADYFMCLFPVALALLLWSQRGKRWGGIFLSLAGFGAAFVLACQIPSIFAILVLTLTGLVLGLYFTGRDWFGVGRRLGMGLTLVVGLTVLVLLAFITRERVELIFHPERDALGAGYWINAIRQLLAEAEWFGAAEPTIGLSTDQMIRSLTDIAPLVYMIWRLGWFPFLLLMAAFFGFFLWAFYKVFKLRQTLGRAVSLAVLVTLLPQMVFSLTETLGYPIFGGVAFPLVMGNWNTVLDLFLIGLMLSAFRDGAMPERAAAPGPSPLPRRVTWRDGALTIRFRSRA